jgi:cytochrome c oxidase cbb3-type subunit 2
VHLINPRDVVPESIMPAYPWLEENDLETEDMPARMNALKKLGVPYTTNEVAESVYELEGKKEIDAVIAYLQSLGLAIKTRR